MFQRTMVAISPVCATNDGIACDLRHVNRPGKWQGTGWRHAMGTSHLLCASNRVAIDSTTTSSRAIRAVLAPGTQALYPTIVQRLGKGGKLAFLAVFLCVFMPYYFLSNVLYFQNCHLLSLINRLSRRDIILRSASWDS